MAAVLLIFAVCVLSFSSVDGQDVAGKEITTSVAGPDFFVTDGTRELNLTCQTDMSPVFSYGWILPGPVLRHCNSQTKLCTFRPQMDDDGGIVTCLVQNSSYAALSRASLKLNLQYPPAETPDISITSSSTKPLTQGDIITCTVTGGKPRVTSVIFHCQHPDHAGQRDDVSDDGRNVSSSITVDTTNATEQDMECTCKAKWDPEPGLYPDETKMSFQLKYKAVVTQFTVNATDQLTVNETSHSTVEFKCQGAGRPSPALRLCKQDNNTCLQEFWTTANMQALLYSIDNATGEDMGSYRCEADNGFSSPKQKYVSLLVESAPRIIGSYNSSNPQTLPPGGLTFEMVAYPTPEFKESYFLGNGDMTTRNPAQKNTFKTTFTRKTPMGHLVDCHVTPQNVPSEKVGLYEMYVNNELSNTSFRFWVDRPVHLEQDGDSPTKAIALGILVPVVLVGIIVIIVYGLRRRKMNDDQRRRNDRNNDNLNNETTATPHDSRSDFNATDTNGKTKDCPSSTFIEFEAGYATPGEVGKTDRRSTDSEQDDYNRLNENTAPPVDSSTYSRLDGDSHGAQPEGSADSATPNSIASRPDKPTDKTIGPMGDVYATVAPKQKGGNPPPTDEE